MADHTDDFSRSQHQFSTLVELLRYRARHHSDQSAYTFLQDGETEAGKLTYQDLDLQARAIAAQLQSQGTTGERALLLYPPGLEFIVAFFGCLYAGVVAVPAYPPRPNQSLSRLQAIATDAQATFALTTTSLLRHFERQCAQTPALAALCRLATDVHASGQAEAWQEPPVTRDTLALLQYTSGSTGMPKGVMVSQGNLLGNEHMVQVAFGHSKKTIFVGWLPLFHDMGLIGNVLQPLYLGIPSILMSPVAFVQKPIRWLQAISRYKATTSGAANFAYDLCVHKITPEQRASLDLSSWEVAFNGSEPVRAETLERFVETFAPYGFRREAFYPCYGMAEATLFVSGGVKTAAPVFQEVESLALEHNQVVTARSTEGARTIVGCGWTWLDQRLVIVNPESCTLCADDEIGEIWVTGPNVAQGYWNRPEETQQTFGAYIANTGEGPFLRTGDLGFLQDAELFVTGRLKDLIIIRGRNHYPQDIELTVENSHPALQPGCGAAFSVEAEGEERLVVVQEVRRTHLRRIVVEEVVSAIRQAVAAQHELQTYTVLLLRPGSIPKTSSGKIQRRACRTDFLQHSLKVSHSWTLDIPEHGAPRSEPGKSTMQPTSAMTPRAAMAAPDETASRVRADGLIQWLRGYAQKRVNSRLIDERRCIPPYIVLDLGNQGILGMQVPEQYGGLALNSRDTLRVFEQLAAIDLTLASFVSVHHVLGTRPIMHYAQPAVRDELLPRLAQGRELAAFAVTEPGAGSNPAAMAATAVPDSRGGWRLRGQKVWIGSGSWAGAINVFVQLLDAHHTPLGITGFVVRQGTEGLHQGPEALTMGMRGMVQNAVDLHDVPVAAEDMLGAAGGGLDVAQDAMMYGRLGLAALSVGGMKRCAQLMHRYATRRSIATGRLLDNPLTLVRFSELTAAIVAVETLVARIAECLDQGGVVPVEAYAACKTSGPEFLYSAADHLVQMLGGRGYIETNIAPQLLRDARLLRIFEGPTETLNMFLGSRLINHSKTLDPFLSQVLGAPAVSQALSAAIAPITERCAGPKAPFSDRTAALRWAYVLSGEMATFAILWAAVQGAFERSGEARLRRASEWARLHFEQKLARALSNTPAEAVVSGADALTDCIADYADAIGDLEQTLAGEGHELDELLRQQPPTARTDLTDLQVRRKAAPPQEEVFPSEEKPRDASVSSPSLHTAESIQNKIVALIAGKLRLEASAIDPASPFVDYGLDSVITVELMQEVADWLQQPLEVTLVWSFPTIEALARHLASTINTPASHVETHAEQLRQEDSPQVSAHLDTLSEAEIAELLRDEIATARQRKSP